MHLRSNPSGDTGLPMPSIEGLSDDEAIPVVIAELEKIEKRDEPAIYGMQGISTVNELIATIRDKTPQGLEMLALWRRTEVHMRELKSQGNDGSPSLLRGLRDRLGSALRKVTGR